MTKKQKEIADLAVVLEAVYVGANGGPWLDGESFFAEGMAAFYEAIEVAWQCDEGWFTTWIVRHSTSATDLAEHLHGKGFRADYTTIME